MRLLWLLLFFATTLFATTQEYSYSYVPKTVYKDQTFSITIRQSQSNTIQKPQFHFRGKSLPLNTEPTLTHNGNNNFYTFYFKANLPTIQTPSITIYSDNNTTLLPPHTVALKVLQHIPKNYSGILSNNVNVKSYQTTHYDELHHIVILQLEAMQTNLKAFTLKGLDHSSIEILEQNHGSQIGELFIVVPSVEKELRFSYYHTVKHKFVELVIPLEISKSVLLSADELNPKTDTLAELKRFFLGVATLFFLIMFLWKRDFLYLVLLFILVLLLYKLYAPQKEICIKEGSPLYLLPTKGSTVGIYINKETHTKVLSTRQEYSKIEYKPNIIGWIKNENTCND